MAGDLALGRQFLTAVEPFIYRRYLNFAEINGIKALGIPTATGRFGAMMDVELVNDGPVTLIVETQ